MKNLPSIRLFSAALLLASMGLSQPVPSVKQYFEALGQVGPVATPPDLEKMINSATPDDLRAALPLVFSSLPSSNPEIVMQGGMALIGAGLREDSAELLKPSFGQIYGLFDTRWAGLAITVLTELRPKAPPETFEPVLAYVTRTDQSTQIQAAAIGFLLAHDSGDDKVVAAARQFAARSLDLGARISLLDVITLYFKGNEQALPTVAASMHDATPVVRNRAIYDLTRLGPIVLDKYSADLLAMVNDPNEDEKVRASAQRAIAIWAGRPDPEKQIPAR